MNDPLLSTKLNTPITREDLVPRGRLTKVLDSAPSHRLILIAAPAGFGKTTLMTTWVREKDLPYAWLSLDSDDNNLKRFMTYAATALQRISPEAGVTTLALLQSAQPIGMESLLTVLINELSNHPADFYLLLDDYHLIEEDEVHTALSYLIENMPSQMHVVLTSRSDPPLSLSRLRARGQLLELRQADLRFTAEEAASFLEQLALDLTAKQIAALEERTEGWIAGLQLAALSMRRREDLGSFIDAFSGSHRFIIDYLAEEVFSQQSDELRRFLQETATLERFNAELCDTLTGREDSAAVLRSLEEANLFLIPLDDQREWYRYHHLFRDFLLTRLSERVKGELNKKAGAWFKDQGFSTEAVKYALASGDLELAEAAITSAAVEALTRADFQSLFAWLDALPDKRVRRNTALSLYKSYALFLTSSTEAAFPFAQAAEATLGPDTPVSIEGQFMSLKAQLLLFEDQLDDAINIARNALEYLDEGDQFFRNLTLNALGQILEMKGDVEAAADIYRQAFEAGWRAGDRYGALVVFTNLVFALNELGRRREAATWCENLIAEIMAQDSSEQPLLEAAYLPWSMLAFEANELDQAREYAERALAFLQATNFPQGIIWAQYILAGVLLAGKEIQSALGLIEEGRQLVARTGRGDLQGVWFTALDAQVRLNTGDLSSALQWTDGAGFTPQDSPHHWFEWSYFTYTRVLIAQGQFEDAISLLDTMEENASEGNRNRKLITIHLLRAWCLEEQGKTPKALESIERALELASPNDYLRAFLSEDPKIVQLLPKVRHLAPSFVDELLYADQGPAGGRDEPLMDPLTEREREVLELVAKGLSNRQIADVLFVTVGTVKKHLNNVFGKLHVESRTQAISRGRELNLLD